MGQSNKDGVSHLGPEVVHSGWASRSTTVSMPSFLPSFCITILHIKHSSSWLPPSLKAIALLPASCPSSKEEGIKGS